MAAEPGYHGVIPDPSPPAPRLLSGRARWALRHREADYRDELLAEATRITERKGADVISRVDVELADERLRGAGPAEDRGFWVTALGGVMLGGGFGKFLDALVISDPTRLEFGLSAIVMFAGLVAILRERRAR